MLRVSTMRPWFSRAQGPRKRRFSIPTTISTICLESVSWRVGLGFCRAFATRRVRCGMSRNHWVRKKAQLIFRALFRWRHRFGVERRVSVWIEPYTTCQRVIRGHLGSHDRGITVCTLFGSSFTMDFGLCDDVPRAASQSKSGAQKRRERAHLPRVFYLYDRKSRLVHGGAVFTSVVKLANTTEAEWVVCRGVPLQTPMTITPDMCAYISAVFKVKPVVECDVRLASARVGGMVSDHFLEFAHASYLCFTLPLADIDQVMSDPGRATSIRTPATYVRMCGVEAETVVAALPIAAANVDVDEEAPDSGVAPQAPPPVRAPEASSSSASAPAAMLQGLYTVQPHGLVTHRYHARGLLQYLSWARQRRCLQCFDQGYSRGQAGCPRRHRGHALGLARLRGRRCRRHGVRFQVGGARQGGESGVAAASHALHRCIGGW